jgi:hypothetical protein
MLSFCISDQAKQMLLDNPGFIPHLIDGLLLHPEHPRAASDESIKSAVQRDYAACILHMSLFEPGKLALQAAQHQSDIERALRALVATGWSEEARQIARNALVALEFDGGGERIGLATPRLREAHVMLSYQWDHQAVLKRVNLALKARKYNVWIDIEKMQGSTVEAMADAVEYAAAFCCTYRNQLLSRHSACKLLGVPCWLNTGGFCGQMGSRGRTRSRRIVV